MGCFCYEKRALRVWSLVFRWLGIGFITPSNLFVHLECFIEEARLKKLRFFLFSSSVVYIQVRFFVLCFHVEASVCASTDGCFLFSFPLRFAEPSAVCGEVFFGVLL